MAERRHRPNARPAAPQARDKLTFLLALVPWLLENERVTVDEAATYFGVSAEQVRESVALIATSGVPGSTTTYQHEDLFDIDWDAFDEGEIAITHHIAIDEVPRFSAREAAALIAGLRTLQSLPENADSSELQALVDKLARGASSTPNALAVAAGGDAQLAALIGRGIGERRRLRFGYLTARGDSEVREVDPLRVESIDADLYLRGWCHLRDALRTFRIDRMSDVEITEVAALHDPSEVDVPDTLFEPSDEDLVVTIEVTPEVMGLISDYIADGATITELGDDRIRTSIRVSHYHGLKRLVAGLPGTVRVVAPEQARQAVAEWAAAGAARYA